MEQRFQYRSLIQEVPAIRNDLSSLQEQWDIPNSEFKQILFMVEELFSNIIRYAYEDTHEHHVELLVKKHNERIVLEIRDDGIPFDPISYHPELNSNPADAQSSGMGLSLVKTFADSITYERRNDRNCLEIVKTLKSNSV
jgi:anti-sigma regulatory factor (Ser/Thr protein kinase)